MPFLSRFKKPSASVRAEKLTEIPDDVGPKAKPVGVVARLMGLDMFPAEAAVGKPKKQAEGNFKFSIPEKPIGVSKFTPDIMPTLKQINALAGLPPLIPFSDSSLQNDTSSKASDKFPHSRDTFPARNKLSPRLDIKLQPAIHSAALMQPWQLADLSDQLIARQVEVREKLNEAKLLLRGERSFDLPSLDSASRPNQAKDLIETLNFLHSNKNILLTELGQQVLLGTSLPKVSHVISQKDEQNPVTVKLRKITKEFSDSATNLKTPAKQSKGFTKSDEVMRFPKNQSGRMIREVKHEQVRGNAVSGKEIALQHQKRQSNIIVKRVGSDRSSSFRDTQKNQAISKASPRKGQIIKPLTSPSISPRFYAQIPKKKEAIRQGNSATKRNVEQEARKELRGAKDKTRNEPLDSKEIVMQMVAKIKRGVTGGFEVGSDGESDPSCMIRNRKRLSANRKRIDGIENRGASDGEGVPDRKNLRYGSMPSSISLPSSPSIGIKGATTVSTEEGKQQLLERLRGIKADQADHKQRRVSSQSGKLAQRAAGRQALPRSDLVSERPGQQERKPILHDPSKQLDDRNSERSSRKHSSLGRSRGSVDSSRENSPRLGRASQLLISSAPIEDTIQNCAKEWHETKLNAVCETGSDKAVNKIRKGSSKQCTSTINRVLKEEALVPRRSLQKEDTVKSSIQLASSKVEKFGDFSGRSDHISDCEVEESDRGSEHLSATGFSASGSENLTAANFANLAGKHHDRRIIHSQCLQAYDTSMQELIKQSLDQCPQVIGDEPLSCSTETSSLCNAFDEASQEDCSLRTPENKFPIQDSASTGEIISHTTSPKTEKLSPVSVLESTFEDIGHECHAPLECNVGAKLSEPLLKHQPYGVNSLENLKVNLTNVHEAKETVVRQITYSMEPLREDHERCLSECIATERRQISSLSKGLFCPKGLEFHLDYFHSLLAVAGVGFSPKTNKTADFLSSTHKIDPCIFHRLKEQYMNYHLEKYIKDSIGKLEKEPIMSYFKIEKELGLDDFSQRIIFDLTNMYLIELQPYNYPWISTGKAVASLSTAKHCVQQVWREVCDCFSKKPLEAENPLEHWLELNVAKQIEKMKLWEELDQLGFEIENMIFDDLVEEMMLTLQFVTFLPLSTANQNEGVARTGIL